MAVTLLGLASLAVVGVIGCNGLADFQRYKNASIGATEDYLIQPNTAIRQRRGTSATALVMQGSKAVRVILKGAKQVPSDNHSFKMFQKPGNLQTALRDFKATKPVPVSGGHDTFPFGPKINYMDDRVYGQAGDRILRLEKYDESTGRPIMTIMQKIDSSHYKVYKLEYTQ